MMVIQNVTGNFVHKISNLEMNDDTLTNSDQAISIRVGGAKTPLFLIYVEAEPTQDIRGLKNHIERDVPVYGLRAGIMGTPAISTVQGLASQLIRQIKMVQGQGPYRAIASFSTTALVYEIAYQLIGEDQCVEFIGLIDLTSAEDRGGQSREPRVQSPQERWRVSEWQCLPGITYDDYEPAPLPLAVDLFCNENSAAEQQLSLWLAVGSGATIRTHRLGGDRLQINRSNNWTQLGNIVSQSLKALPAIPRPIAEQKYSSLVVLQTGGSNEPALVCVPGAGGNVTSFLPLAEHMGRSISIYGLQPRGIDGVLVPHSSVRAAAEQHVLTILKIGINAPINLLGHSFGGWLAFEIACQLESEGQTVASLTLLDSDVPDTDELDSSEHSQVEIFEKLIEIYEQLTEKRLGIKSVELEKLNFDGKRNLLHDRLVEVGFLNRRTTPMVLQGTLRSFASSVRTRYQPRSSFKGPLSLVLVADPKLSGVANISRYEKSVQEWRRWAPGVSTWNAPGNHMTILDEPYVQVLARWLSTRVS